MRKCSTKHTHTHINERLFSPQFYIRCFSLIFCIVPMEISMYRNTTWLSVHQSSHFSFFKHFHGLFMRKCFTKHTHTHQRTSLYSLHVLLLITIRNIFQGLWYSFPIFIMEVDCLYIHWYRCIRSVDLSNKIDYVLCRPDWPSLTSYCV
jgi:hypothetical protein